MKIKSFEEKLLEGAYSLAHKNDQVCADLNHEKSRNVRLSMLNRYIIIKSKLAAEAKRWESVAAFLAVTGTMPVIWIRDANDWFTRTAVIGFFLMALFGLSLSYISTRFQKRAKRFEARFGHLTRSILT